MAKVYGIHELELRPGVSAEEFERFCRDELARVPAFPGWRVVVGRGDRGERAGRYALVFEIDDVEARDRFAPGPGRQSAEQQAFLQTHPQVRAVIDRLRTLATSPSGQMSVFTDYVVLE